MLLKCLESNTPLFLSSSPPPPHCTFSSSMTPSPPALLTAAPSLPLPHTCPFRAGILIPEESRGTEVVEGTREFLCAALPHPAHRNLPGFPCSFYILTAVWDHQGLTSLQADTHPVPSEITWRHQRPPQPPPLGPWPRSRHSPLQTARRIRPLLTRLSMARRASSVIPTKGMHRRAAEKAGTEGPKEGH